MITIINYNSGNLRSIHNGFTKIGYNAEITSNPEKIADSEFLVLPGVGAFGSVMKNIEPFKDLIYEHINDDKPFLGICLGLQVLLSSTFTKLIVLYPLQERLFISLCVLS